MPPRKSRHGTGWCWTPCGLKRKLEFCLNQLRYNQAGATGLYLSRGLAVSISQNSILCIWVGAKVRSGLQAVERTTAQPSGTHPQAWMLIHTPKSSFHSVGTYTSELKNLHGGKKLSPLSWGWRRVKRIFLRETCVFQNCKMGSSSEPLHFLSEFYTCGRCMA